MRIIKKTVLAEHEGIRITQVVIAAPLIAQKAQAGQFVVVMVKKEGERIPLTIVDKNEDTITLIFQEAGLTTKILGAMEAGDSLYTLVGPLGNPTAVKKYGNLILVGGGVGIAEIYPVAKALQEAGNTITSIIGARSSNVLLLEKELQNLSGYLFVTTDDGTLGRKGFVTDVLEELLQKQKYDFVYCVGPIPMMKKVAAITAGFKIKTEVSLNALMVDATGMCGSCRVSIEGKTKFSCVDGPDFDAHLVDWDELEKRNRIYLIQERHICKLNII